jgi:hypothetical protein
MKEMCPGTTPIKAQSNYSAESVPPFNNHDAQSENFSPGKSCGGRFLTFALA